MDFAYKLWLLWKSFTNSTSEVNPMRLLFLVPAAFVLAASTFAAHADELSGYDSGTLGTNQIVGQAFTVSGTGNYTDITFNFFAPNETTMEAPGTGYLLSEEYLGTLANLNSSTPGYIASVAGSDGSYDFGSITLTAGDTYYLYSTSGVSSIGQAINGQISFGYGSLGFFVATDGGNLGNDFQVTGTPVTPATAATPEPSTLALFGTGILGLAGMARRKFLA